MGYLIQRKIGMNFRQRYIGDRNEFSIDKRIFHVLCLILTIASLVGAIVNIILKLPFFSIVVTFLFTLLPFSVYFMSRFRGRYNLSRNLFLIVGYAFLVFLWYYDAGMDGYIQLILFSVITWQLVFDNGRKYFWLGLNMIIILCLTLSDFFFPEWVLWHHASRLDRALDFIFTYVIMGIATFFIFRTLLKEYSKERELVSEKNRELLALNERLKAIISEMKKIDQTRSKLFSVVSHDIRSFAGDINNFSGLLLDSEHSGNKNRETEYKHYIYNSSINLKSVLENLLSWARLQMESIPVNIEQFDLKTTVENILFLFEYAYKEKRINVELQCNTNVAVVADVEMVKSIIRNLISNAIKFSHPGGIISISIEKKESSDFVLLRVTDQGIGMTANELELLQTPDDYFTKYGTQKEKGTGLGFIISREFAEKNKGYLTVTSKAGVGSTFTLGLPTA